MRNKYNQGTYGYEVLQIFESKSLGRIAVDRGWVKAGADAKTPPNVPSPSLKPDQILVRVRSEFLQHRISGSFFALPAKPQVRQEIYFDLLEAQINKPITQIELPDLSTGPHYAYAFQWFIFSIVIIFGRVLLSRKLNRKPDRS